MGGRMGWGYPDGEPCHGTPRRLGGYFPGPPGVRRSPPFQEWISPPPGPSPGAFQEGIPEIPPPPGREAPRGAPPKAAPGGISGILS